MDDFLQVILEETEKVFKPIINARVPFLLDIDKPNSDVDCADPDEDPITPTSLAEALEMRTDQNDNDKDNVTISNHNPLLSQNGAPLVHQCKHCPLKFPTKQQYSCHLQKSHVQERPFRCLYCEKSFSTKNILKQHERIHTKERPYACQYCCKTFSHRTAVANHIRTHTGEKPFDCTCCEKSFGEKAKLLLHMRVHTGEKPFVCNHCQRAFRDKSSYNVHLRIHTGEKPFKCNFCQRSFTHRNSFKDHLRIHTGERPFVCVHCNRDFAKQSTLRKHLEVHGVVKPVELNVHAIIKPYNNMVMTKKINNAVKQQLQPQLGKGKSKRERRIVENLQSQQETGSEHSSEESVYSLPSNEPAITNSVSPSTALSIVQRMLRVKEKEVDDWQVVAQPLEVFQSESHSYASTLCSLHENRTHVCPQCRSKYENETELQRHVQSHSDESRAWKMGIDVAFLFTSILGLEVTEALGFVCQKADEVLEEFVTVAGGGTNNSSGKETNFTRMQELVKTLLATVVSPEDLELGNVDLDGICVCDLLYDMMAIYQSCDNCG